MNILFFAILKNEDSFKPLSWLSYKIELLLDFTTPRQLRDLFKKVQNNTLVNYSRIKSLSRIAQTITENNIEGAFVECGVWRGGCAAVMTYISQKLNLRAGKSMRQVYLFDSFQGLPHVTEHDGVGAAIFSENKLEGKLDPIHKNVASEEAVRNLFKDLAFDMSYVNIIKGWFQETLPEYKSKIGKIALLRLDGDWYESTKVCLDNLYANVISGGYIIIDDYYFWEGCKKATDEFLRNNNIMVRLKRTDFSGVYFVKP